MTFGQIPSDVDLKLKEIVREGQGHRKYENLVTEWKVRTRHGIRTISTPGERMAFLFLVWAEQNPRDPISQAIIDEYYGHNRSLAHLKCTSSDTILRDNRAMEDKGLFPKPQVAQQTL